jgi:hypothetical protein
VQPSREVLDYDRALSAPSIDAVDSNQLGLGVESERNANCFVRCLFCRLDCGAA